MPWYTVIARYEDEPQTVADWLLAETAKQAAQRCADERGEACNVLAVLSGKRVLHWTPETMLIRFTHSTNPIEEQKG